MHSHPKISISFPKNRSAACTVYGHQPLISTRESTKFGTSDASCRHMQRWVRHKQKYTLLFLQVNLDEMHSSWAWTAYSGHHHYLWRQPGSSELVCGETVLLYEPSQGAHWQQIAMVWTLETTSIRVRWYDGKLGWLPNKDTTASNTWKMLQCDSFERLHPVRCE